MKQTKDELDDAPVKITFFERLTPFIESGKKTITIRDESESHYVPGTRVTVYTLETNRRVCEIEIESVEQIDYNNINEIHAVQEDMELAVLKDLIRQIYPDTNSLFVISFKLIG